MIEKTGRIYISPQNALNLDAGLQRRHDYKSEKPEKSEKYIRSIMM